MRLRNISLYLFLLILTPVVNAQTPSIGNALGNAFQIIFNILNQRYVQFGLTVIFLVLLFYNLFNAGLSRVSVFGGSGKANKYGRVVSLSLSIMATLGILYFGGTGPEGMVERILTTMGWLGGVAFAATVFGITYFNMKGSKKTWPVTLISAGITLVVLGMFQNGEGLLSFGIFFLFFGLIMFLFSGNASNTRQSGRNFGRGRGDKTPRTDSGSTRTPKGGIGSGPTMINNCWAKLIPEKTDNPGGSKR